MLIFDTSLGETGLQCGGGNTPWSMSCKPEFGTSASVSFWNARALLHHDKKLRAKKRDIVIRMLQRSQVVVLTETHGNEEDLRFLLGASLHDQLVFASSIEGRSNAGGIARLGIIGQDHSIASRAHSVRGQAQP